MATQTIRFCDICENKYYHHISDDKLVYYCRVCGKVDDISVSENVCVLNIKYGQDHGSKPIDMIVNRYTKYDPTLPRIALPCPNARCENNKNDKTSEVIYIRHDNNNMKHLYMCVDCDHIWKSHE